MLELKHDIRINENQSYGLILNYCHQCKIESTWDNLTDTATLEVPRKIRYEKDGEVIKSLIATGSSLDPLTPYLRRGDEIKINSGYGSQIAGRFSGLITNVMPRNPLFIEMEDVQWLNKQFTISPRIYTNTTHPQLSDIVFDLWRTGAFFGAQPVVNLDVEMGRILIKSGTTTAKLLKWLRDKYGIISYYRNGVLQIGAAYDLKDIDQLEAKGRLHQINLEELATNTQGLSYVREDDQKIKVKAISIRPDNTKITKEVGDPDGGERTMYFYDVDLTTLTTLADEALEKIKYTGVSGSFEMFLNPRVSHGDAVKITSTKIPDFNGTFMVKKVTTTSGIDGGRQVIELDIRID